MVRSQEEKIGKPKSPFEAEDLRTKFATDKDYDAFKKKYSTEYPEIKAENTNSFWNDKFKTPTNFSELDTMTKEKINIIISFLPYEEIRILDLGIGQGYLEQRLQEMGRKHELYGIDISEKAISRARKKFSGKFKLGDVLKIRNYYANYYFDAIIAIELIEHISPSRIFSFYQDIYDLLKPNGMFILSTPLNEHLRQMKENPSSHVREYTEHILQAELEISRFKIIEKKFLFAFRNLYGIKKFLSKIFKNWWGANNIVIKAVKL